ncbi:hypothetical protein RHGRI_023271 [Rhododendron griersonianum]|uniref:Uncharacterized protein n=1 Tax=Rhododendron griersonianum TaxID=479676 RepID=A0AAV6J2Q7_9ERIC|nr:hypothetical protein RHGRI_023271 [Rhododendron griersonianum]
MGRAPCCDKANVKRGPWSPDEDATLKSYIDQHGTCGNWIALPQKIGLKRCGKSCRLRWLNYLRPNIKHGGFSEEEDNIICSLYLSIGSRWSIIAAQLPGRTDNDIKNYWNTRLKKKLMGKQRKEQRASSIKHEMKRECESFVVNPHEAMNPILYWPELPLHDTYLQYPFDVSTTQDQPCDNSTITFASSTSMNSVKSSSSTFSQMPNMFQGFNNYQIDLGEIVYGTPQQVDGLESFAGVDMVNLSSTGSGISSVESNSWGDINSLVYSPMVPHYEGTMQGSTCEASYFGLQ